MLENKSSTGTRQTNEITISKLLCMPFVCPSAVTLALQHGGFVPREWLATLGSVNSHCSGNERARTRSCLLLYTPLLYCPLAVRSAHVISCCLAQAKRKQHQEAMILK